MYVAPFVPSPVHFLVTFVCPNELRVVTDAGVRDTVNRVIRLFAPN